MRTNDREQLLEGISKKVGPDKWKYKGQTGHWRTVRGNEVFFPDGGGKPLGVPKKLNWFQRAIKKLRGEGVEVTMAHAFALCEGKFDVGTLVGMIRDQHADVPGWLRRSTVMSATPVASKVSDPFFGLGSSTRLRADVRDERGNVHRIEVVLWGNQDGGGVEVLSDKKIPKPTMEWGGRNVFQDPGGKSALRKATKGNPRTYQCDDCADLEEGPMAEANAMERYLTLPRGWGSADGLRFKKDQEAWRQAQFALITKAKRLAALVLHDAEPGDTDVFAQGDEANPTGIAELVAHELDHDEWLDDETHWIWEVAMEAATQWNKGRGWR